MNECEVVVYTVPSGTDSKIIETLSVGRIPKQVIFVAQTSDRSHGSIQKNAMVFPRVFEKPGSAASLDASLVSVKLTVGHTEVDGLWVERPDAQFSVNYYKYFLLNSMLAGGHNLPCDLTPERFSKDFHFYYFDLGVSMGQNVEWTKDPVKAGPMRAYFNFSRATEVPITIYAIIISDACIVLDKAGRVTKEST